MPNRETFRALLQRVIDQQFDGKDSRLGQAMGVEVTPRRFIDQGTMSEENCLRFAKIAANVSPLHVLRLAGKEEFADLLEELFPHVDPETTPVIQRVCGEMKALKPEAQNVLADLVTMWAAAENRRNRSK